MGIARGAVALMLEEAHRSPFAGKIGTLGRQTLYTTAAEIAVQFAKFQVAPKERIDTTATEVSDTDLFKWMGFESVESLDYSDFEGATHILDLNKPSIPEHLTGAYDVVLDSGTLEHIFHFPNAIKNTLSLLKVGGRIIFLSPSSNHVDHGFYMFSPTLFADYFAANGFQINTLYLVRYSGDLNELWEAYAYQPGQWRNMHIGGCDDRPYVIWAVATRLENSTVDIIPQQGFYSDASAAYVGSHLATGTVAKGATASQGAPIPQASIAPNEDPVVAPISTKSILRRMGRKIPGARHGWRLTRALLNKLPLPAGSRVKALAPTHEIFRKKLVGKF
jgi:hypothetical protein